jgi:choline-glycine betaine transporter
MPETGCQWEAEARDDSCLVRIVLEFLYELLSDIFIVTVFGMIYSTLMSTFAATHCDSYASFVKQSLSNHSYPPQGRASNTGMHTSARMPFSQSPLFSNTLRV